jgi:hypothetical protein
VWTRMDALVFLAIAFMLGSFVVRPAQRLDAERSPRLIAAGQAALAQAPIVAGKVDDCLLSYFRSFRSSCAASSDEAGFWPVINWPSTTTCDPQSAPLS